MEQNIDPLTQTVKWVSTNSQRDKSERKLIKTKIPRTVQTGSE